MRSFLPPSPTAKDHDVARKQAMVLALTQVCAKDFEATRKWILHGGSGAELLEEAEVLADVYEEKGLLVDWSKPFPERMAPLLSKYVKCRRPPLEAVYLQQLVSGGRQAPAMKYQWRESGLSFVLSVAPGASGSRGGDAFSYTVCSASAVCASGNRFSTATRIARGGGTVVLARAIVYPFDGRAAEREPVCSSHDYAVKASKKLATIFDSCAVKSFTMRFEDYPQWAPRGGWKRGWEIIYRGIVDE